MKVFNSCKCRNSIFFLFLTEVKKKIPSPKPKREEKLPPPLQQGSFPSTSPGAAAPVWFGVEQRCQPWEGVRVIKPGPVSVTPRCLHYL